MILVEADLSGADLFEADLGGSACNNAKFVEAKLGYASLRNTHFILADLRRSDLAGVDLREAELDGADLSGAEAGWTAFADVDLSTVKGLDTVTHAAPSTIGVDTLLKSHGQIPESFLRGCGLNDWQIEAAKLHRPDLPNDELGDIIYRIHDLRARQAIQINPLFISSSHTDARFVVQLERYFVEDGILFWRDVRHATAGRLEKQIDRAIRLNPTVLLILSESSVESDWVEHEARLARKLEKELGRDVLCPVALDGSWKECRWPERLREQIEEYNILDFSEWRDGTAFDRMYRRLVEGLDLFYRGKRI